MIWRIPKSFEDAEIIIPVKTLQPQRLHATCSNIDEKGHPNTVYFDSDAEIDGINQFNIRLPKFPDTGVLLEIYNEENGHINNDPTFRVGKDRRIEELDIPLKTIKDNSAASFAKFAYDLSEDAGFIPAKNSIYVSPDGKFRVDYKDVIRDDKGRELATPARVNANTGIIEISKKYFLRFSVFGRFAILWHEWAHVYKNSVPEDEKMADKWAISYYLGLGCPKIEILRVFLKTFQNTPSDLNVERYNLLEDFAKNWDASYIKKYDL